MERYVDFTKISNKGFDRKRTGQPYPMPDLSQIDLAMAGTGGALVPTATGLKPKQFSSRFFQGEDTFDNLHFYLAWDAHRILHTCGSFMDTTFPFSKHSDYTGGFIIWERVSYRDQHRGHPLAFIIMKNESFISVFEKINAHCA